MEKIVKIDGRVDDLCGLMIDLKRAGFEVRNVGADPSTTYVYVEPWEEKDPTEIASPWIGRPTPPMSDRELWERRAADLKALNEGNPKPTEEARASRGPSLLGKIFRKIMG
jgi:hypothetical protein